MHMCFAFTINSYWLRRNSSLRWHNEHNGVSNHQPHDLKLRATGLRVGNSPVTGECPAQKTSNAENVSISWRHHEYWYLFGVPGVVRNQWSSAGVPRPVIHAALKGLCIFLQVPQILKWVNAHSTLSISVDAVDLYHRVPRIFGTKIDVLYDISWLYLSYS